MVNNSVYFYNSGQQQIGATAGVTTQQSPSHHQPQTPQTPSSIPDIIFTGTLTYSYFFKFPSPACPKGQFLLYLNVQNFWVQIVQIH